MKSLFQVNGFPRGILLIRNILQDCGKTVAAVIWKTTSSDRVRNLQRTLQSTLGPGLEGEYVSLPEFEELFVKHAVPFAENMKKLHEDAMLKAREYKERHKEYERSEGV